MGSASPWQRISPRRHRGAILAFHDVRDRNWFREFLQQLAERAVVVSLASLVDDHASKAKTRPRVALTFDDGYTSIRTVVEPVCTELGLPFTTFVCGDVLTGGPVPWYDRVYVLVKKVGSSRAAGYWGMKNDPGRNLVSALKEAPQSLVLRGLERAESDGTIDSRPLRDGFMNLEDLAVVARNGLTTVGSHTYSHPILSNLSPSEQRAEIQHGLDAIRDVCRSPVEFFAYPNGKPRDFDANVIAALRDAGIRAAVTTVQRPLLPADDAMQLPRLGVSEGDSIAKLDLKWTVPWFSVGDMREEFWRRRYRGLWSET